MVVELGIDMVFAVGLLTVAITCLLAEDVFKSIVLFVCIGLLTAIIWARLNAWDVAIAEAAIGSGLTGCLLMITLRRLAQIPTTASSVRRGSKHV